MLGFLLTGLMALAPLLRGSWDQWAQTFLQLFVSLGMLLWLLGKTFSGTVPLPSPQQRLWIFLLFLLSGISRILSPLHALADPGWLNLLLGLWILFVFPLVSEEQRLRIEATILNVGWILFLLAFYQRFFGHEEFPSASLINANSFAGYILLVFPLALEKKKGLLGFCLLWTLLWTGSKGAWISLSVALMVLHFHRRGLPFWAGLFIAALCLVMMMDKMSSPGVTHRLLWWKAAWNMVSQRPWVGFGPGAYGYVFPSFHVLSVQGLSTLYAHNYFLEVFAELGILFGLIWFGGIARLTTRLSRYKKMALLAILSHSLIDYGLSIPANFWIFCAVVASGLPPRECPIHIPGRLKAPLMVSLFLAGLCWVGRVYRPLRYEKLLAKEHFEEARKILPQSPLAHIGLSRLFYREYLSRKEPHLLLESIRYGERAIELNPYRLSGWEDLRQRYRDLGRNDLAEEALQRGKKYQWATHLF
ncbi:MAG: O-antigen ligase family protein [Elusimicrobia bacterium]|nr:O-antigen ligase family protein [Elusimicrobiota bacterium]